ncbi:peptidase family m13 domain-containing protein [Ditylenchus destructor]|nr:peptidase family m13 domain-containing protein [Ditylenchus destructor]
MTSKRSTALGATVGLLAVAVLAISVVTLIKVYSTEPPQTQAGSDTGDSSGNGKTDGSNSNNTPGNPEGVLNIPAPPTVNQQSSVQFQAYSGYAQQLHSSVNLGVNPCVDFYTYACGQYNQSLGFYEVNLRNFRQIAQQLTNKAYINAFDLPKPVKQSSIFYSKCLDALQNWQSRAVDGDLVVNKLANFGQILGVPFPALTKNGADSTVQLYGFPNSSVLGASLGYLSYTEGLNTLVSFSIETNWKKPHSDQPYALFIDQASLVFPDNYYTKIWDQVRDDYSNETFAIIKAYADYTGANVDEDKLKADVQKILNLEYVIASQKNTPGNVRRNLERLYNPFTVSNATQTFPNIDFFQLIREAVHRTPSRQYSFVIKEVDALNRILNHITSKKVEPATVYNYLYYRILRQNIAYLPSSENKFGPNAFLRVQKSGSIFNELGHIGSTKYNKKRPWVLGQGWKFPDKPDDWQSVYCVAENAISMAHANSRTFLDAVFPEVQGRAMMKDNVAKLVASILDAFQGMVAQLDWMTTDTKWQAYQKIQNLVKNIAYPDLVTDNDALNKFYDQGDISLIFDDDDSFVAIQDALRNFQRDLAIKSLVKAKDTDRLKFGDPGYNSAALVDAWFMEELNSLTIPMGILQKPFYNSEYPSAVNYGSLGSIIGHEIIHGFDDIGVQWDATGVLKTWMDDTSQKGFNKMAQCVIDGYGKFEPLAGMKIDGVQTLGENIADNGGIQAAYRAFQAYRALYGPDPQLPDSLYRVFNHEQLFFMSYAQSWCSKPMSDNYVRERLLVDTHSPVQYRVFGTMQNFPAFKSAFNCPAKSPYAPENPCRVWVSDSVAVKFTLMIIGFYYNIYNFCLVTGVPPTKPTLPPANIPLAVPSTSKKYSQASAFFEYSVDPTKDPCNNFYGYACGNHNDFMSFDYADSYTIEAMVYGLRRPIDNTAARPVKQVKQLYQQCKVAMNNWSDLIKDGARAKDAVSSFLDISEFPFPILSKKTRTYDWPDYESLGIALGYMSGVLDVDTLVTPFVDTDWVEAQSNKIPFKLYLDQATLGLPRVFYIGQTWDLFKDWYTEYVTHLFQRFAAVMPTKLNATALKEDVDAIVQFEYTIANQLTIDDNTRRNFKRSYNPVRPSYIKKKYPKIGKLKRLKKSREEEDDYTLVDLICAYRTMNLMPFANARVYIDQMYPDENNRDYLRGKAAELITNVVNSFKSMVDQLSWMSTKAKDGSYKKVQNLVKNVAYPDFITNDTQLTNYYHNLDFTDPSSYLTMLDDVKDYRYLSMWELIDATGNADRSDFLGPPGSTNAWYQPQLNSITFPASILQQPFYDPEWPASVNYGGLGVVAGHELTHGFDDEGIQWNEVGELREWLDPLSQKGFRKMADCVVKEYNKFCPLNGNIYQPSCVNGDNTQGENIADNGGIRAAFLAYRNFLNLNGPDPQLPGPLAKQFNHDQLFFLSFAQVWCENKPPEDEMFFQLLLDPHSPSEYRVWGTIQNFPAFRSAFNCPAGKAYTPEKHCNVWIDEIKAVTGVPPTVATLPPANIPQAVPSTSKKYTQASSYFEYSIDATKDPCNDFYAYACGNHEDDFMSFDIADSLSVQAMVYGLRKPINDADTRPVMQVKQLYRQCKVALNNWDELIKNGARAKKFINDFSRTTKFPFPLFAKKSRDYSWPSADDLGMALGYMSGVLGVDTLVTPFVDTDWVEAQSNKIPYKLYLDQATLALPRVIYTGQTWDLFQDWYANYVTELFQRFALVINTKLNATALQEDVDAIVQFEYTVANQLTTDDNTRRNFKRSYNPIRLKNQTAVDSFKFINLPYFVAMFGYKYATMQQMYKLFEKENIIVMEPGQFSQYNQAFVADNVVVSPRTLFNYLFYRLLKRNSIYLPPLPEDDDLPDDSSDDTQKTKHEIFKIMETRFYDKDELKKNISELELRARQIMYGYEYQRPLVGQPKHIKKKYPKIRILKRLMKDNEDYYDMLDVECSYNTMGLLPYANARVYIDQMYPDPNTRNYIRNKAAELITNVVNSFKSMVDQLSWMSTKAKEGSYKKVQNLVKNVAYPDFITDDAQLTAFYRKLNFTKPKNFFVMLDDINDFDYRTLWDMIDATGNADRSVFNGPPATTNAWYQPQLNSITFPASILQQPFYDPEWPISINYGGLGVIAGHELTHGFDDEGIQWNEVGELREWLDPLSQKGFRKMADCVVKEYNKFCPLNGDIYQPSCVNGDNTQGENIADNGGIRAAFLAYRNFINLNGQDPQLPGALAKQFNHDQLFFLSFAQVWCEPKPSEDDTFFQLLLDPHSPSEYRVWGTIQNFPAFRSAFNCPAGKAYTPEKHCNVWIDEIKAGLP